MKSKKKCSNPLELQQIKRLDLVTIYADGTTQLVSLRHACVLFDCDGNHPMDYCPHLEVTRDIEEKAGKAFWKDQFVPDDGYPGNDAMIYYIINHREILDYSKVRKENYSCP